MEQQNSTKFVREKLPPARTFYTHEFGYLGRADGRGWVRCKAKCFKCGHGGFGINLNSGAFYCFSCGAKGDALAFYMLRYGVDFVTAYRQLGACEDDRTPIESSHQREEKAERKVAEAARQEQALQELRLARIEVRGWLHLLERLYENTSDRLSELRKGASEKFTAETECCWGILADALPQIRHAEHEYLTLSGVEL